MQRERREHDEARYRNGGSKQVEELHGGDALLEQPSICVAMASHLGRDGPCRRVAEHLSRPCFRAQPERPASHVPWAEGSCAVDHRRELGRSSVEVAVAERNIRPRTHSGGQGAPGQLLQGHGATGRCRPFLLPRLRDTAIQIGASRRVEHADEKRFAMPVLRTDERLYTSFVLQGVLHRARHRSIPSESVTLVEEAHPPAAVSESHASPQKAGSESIGSHRVEPVLPERIPTRSELE